MSGLIGIPPANKPAQGAATATAAPAADGAANAAAMIMDVDQTEFGVEVIEASAQVPVIVDFWAPWCGPCKQLMPVLEDAVAKAGGAVKLAKVNIDDNQQLAAQLRIQSVPTVYAFFQGQPVDGFQGALPPSEINAFVEKLAGLAGGAPGGAAEMIAQALEQAQEIFDAGAIPECQQLLSQILEQDPESEEAIALMIRCFLAGGNQQGAEDFLADLPPEYLEKPAIKSVRASIALSKVADGLGELSELRAKADSDGSFEARFDLARKLIATGASEQGADMLIALITEDREWNDQAARKQLLEMFEAFGPADSFSTTYRRKLSAVLFS